jgi:tRNA nucleotidyltransferase (CCA-adding enzyme)
MTIKIFEVGGHVRDSLMGIKSKDIDMAVEAPSWEAMREHVIANTKKVFLEKPEFLTIRAMGFDGLPKDFVLCRKDGAYSDGRRPDNVEPGTILDDLARRDFTINAIARDTDTGELIDPFGGEKDLEIGLIKCVGDPTERLSEDSLRILRAARFAITKEEFSVDHSIRECLGSDSGFWQAKLEAVSRERVREEMLKCFRHDTLESILFFSDFPWCSLLHSMLKFDLWLKPTLEER